MITVGYLSLWVLQHRRGKAFKDYSMATIINAIDDAINDNTILCYHDDKYIQGVVIGKKDEVNRTIHIFDILTIEPNILLKMVKQFIILYPDYKIEANRRGRIRTYDANKLLKKLNHYGTKLQNI